MPRLTASTKANKSHRKVADPHMVSHQTIPMVSIPIQTETIRLSQVLKLANVVQDGAEAKFRIAKKEVKVNGAVEMRRGRKLGNGDRVEFAGEIYEIITSKIPV